jgi:levansucrase
VSAWWTRRHLDRIVDSPATTAPRIAWPAPRLLPVDDLWDLWPIQEPEGPPVVVDGAELWMALSAPADGHPEDRHDIARLRLLARRGEAWTDLGRVFADGASLGSREWSGSAVRRSDGTVAIFYTAAGCAGEARTTFIQRVVEARRTLVLDNGRVRLGALLAQREIARSHRPEYLPANEISGGPGQIRAFRDPGWFRDPADGRDYLLIAASVPSRDGFMGAVALARHGRDGWKLLPPLLRADGIHHEIERPHVVVRDGRYYLFFSASRHAFHPAGCAPTGLYGFVAPHLIGPYKPLNGSGLVLRNPPAEPDQAYAWLVLDDLRVVSFVNYLNGGRDPKRMSPAEARARFGGTIAPVLRLTLDGARTAIAGGPGHPRAGNYG